MSAIETSFPSLPTTLAIARVQRQIAAGRLVRVLLLSLTIAVPFLTPALASQLSGALQTLVMWALPLGVLAAWIMIGIGGAKITRLLAGTPVLIAAGEFEQAELRLAESVRQFTLLRGVKLMCLHHLAMLRHAQGRFDDAQQLAAAVLRQAGNVPSADPRSDVTARLLLADASLEVGDLWSVYRMLLTLRGSSLDLDEQLQCERIEIEYLARAGAWDQMLIALPQRVQMIELMPAGASGLCYLLLGQAARRVSQSAVAEYLESRARLLVEPAELAVRRPWLQEWIG